MNLLISIDFLTCCRGVEIQCRHWYGSITLDVSRSSYIFRTIDSRHFRGAGRGVLLLVRQFSIAVAQLEEELALHSVLWYDGTLLQLVDLVSSKIL